jgi:anti-sigma factor ChrR (cupin superfamily)
MKGKITLTLAACLVAAAGFAQEAGKAPAKKSAHHAAPQPTAIPAADVKWADVAGAPGVKAADLWGNHEKGAFGAFFKFPAGFSSPLHTHTHEMRIAVISGTFLQTPEGKEEMRLGPGSYLKQPGDGYKHTTGCDKASECVIFAEAGGKFDFKPVAEAKAPEKK